MIDPTLMPCPACTVLDCANCEGVVFDLAEDRAPCPCEAAGHDEYQWPDEDDYQDFASV